MTLLKKKKMPAVFQSGCTDFYCLKQYMNIPIAPNLSPTLPIFHPFLLAILMDMW